MAALPWVILLSGWVIAIGLTPYLSRHYAAARAWGWLAVMFAFPWVGLVLFIVLGRNPLGRKRAVRYRQTVHEYVGRSVLEDIPREDEGACLSSEAQRISRLAAAGGALPVVSGNRATLLDFHPTLETLLADIASAREQVDLAYYIFRDDNAGRRVAEALTDARGRGVACRLLVDAIGSRGMLRTLAPRLGRAGIGVRASLPINLFRRRLARMDLRNHRKIAVIDGHTAYLGSWNVGEGCVGPGPENTYRDLTVRLEGPVVAEIALLFLADWCFETEEQAESRLTAPPPVAGPGEVMQVVPSGPMYPSPAFRDVVIFCIHQAERRITMTTPYLVPDHAMMLAVRLAAQRGVDVRFVVPHSTDHVLVDSVAKSYLRELNDYGVAVYVHHRGLLHAKAMTVDSTVGIIGSANLDLRSFHLDVEANLLVFSEDTIAQIRQRQESYIAESVRLDAAQIRRWGRLRRLGQDMARLFGPLM